MEIEVVGAYGGESDQCRLTCLLVNDAVALDAGSLSRALSVDKQLAVGAIVLTHSHIDHTNSLPFFIENVYERGRSTIDIYASGPTIYAVRKHLFNNSSWPDFSRLPNNLLPAIRFRELTAEVPVFIEGVKFTPIAVDIALELGIAPQVFAVAVVFAANCSFASPLGYQTNLLVMGPGHYRFLDFARAGAPLIILLWLTFALVAPIYYGL